MAEAESTVLITGSSGFIGQALSRALIADGHAVVGLDRPDGVIHQRGVMDVPCDITEEASVASAVTRVRQERPGPLSVVHLAAYYDFSGAPSPLYDRVNIQGTERLIRHLLTGPVDQFVYTSTMLVHAPCEPGTHIHESWPLDPKWDYPKSKLDAEQLIQARNQDMPIVLLRLAGVYDDDCHSVPLANQMQRIYERRLTAKVFPGDTSRGQALVHLMDVVEALRATINHRGTLPHETTLLVGEQDPMTYDALQRAFAREIHGDSDWETTQIPKAVAKAGAWVQDQIPGVEEPFIKPWMIDLADDHYALDTARARLQVHWFPRHSLRETIPRMVAALKRDPAAFYQANKLHGTPPEREGAPVRTPRAAGRP